MTESDQPLGPRPGSAALARLRIVLVGAQHPGNIGAAARAMKVMGLSDLALVAPERYPAADASARASGADDILAAARVVDDLQSAIGDCVLAIGASARDRRTRWPCVDVRRAAAQGCELAASGERVALVFGRERSGLTNPELDLCQQHLQIPCNPAYRSLNLAAAVQVVCYELRMAAVTQTPNAAPHTPVSSDDMEGFYAHLYEVLVAGDFLDPAKPRVLMRRLRRLFNRAAPDRIEINILRGVLRALDPRGR